MKITGDYTLHAPLHIVWKGLMSPVILSNCIPGCQSFELIDDNTYQMIVNVKVGPMNGKYQGTISILDQEIPKSYRLIAEGKGSLGFARGSALVTLSDLSDTTSLLVDGEMEIGGTVARVGQRIIGTLSKTMMDRFFECLTQSILNDSMAN